MSIVEREKHGVVNPHGQGTEALDGRPAVRFQVRRAKNRQWFARIVSRNNQILFTSETYKTRRSALRAFNGIARHFRASVFVDMQP